MRKPTSRTPIPSAVRPIVAAVHKRFLEAVRRGKVPCLDDAGCIPLTATERYCLAACGYYPIPSQVVRRGCTAPEHRRQQIIDAIADQLPDAVTAILEALA